MSGPTAGRYRPSRKIVVWSIVVAVVLALWIAGTIQQRHKSHTVGKYEQTWKLGYTKTLCTQWNVGMDAHQRFVAGHELAGRLLAKDRSDAFAREFEGNIAKGCASAPAGVTVGDIAAALATIDKADFD